MSELHTACKHCNKEIMENFCSGCGNPARPKRIDRHYIIHEIEHVLHFERGILYTIRELLINPGLNVRRYIAEDRSRLVKPIVFLTITSLIYTLISHFFHIEETYISHDPSANFFLPAFKWMQEHYGYTNMLMGIFIAFWTQRLFKKYGYNFFEIFILLCFVMAMEMLLLALFALAEGITGVELLMVANMLGMVYCIWATGQFFDPRRPVSYIKALGAYLLGVVSFFVIIMIIGFIAVLSVKLLA